MSEVQSALTILVVDDKQVIRNALRYYLEAAGYRVLEAGSGPEAIELLQSMPVHLIFLDVMMPQMDGYATARKIRTLPDHAYTPIIVVTARNQPADVLQAVQSGANDYLLKPFSREVFLAKLRKQLGEPGEDLSDSKLLQQLSEEVTKQGGRTEGPPGEPEEDKEKPKR